MAGVLTGFLKRQLQWALTGEYVKYIFQTVLGSLSTQGVQKKKITHFVLLVGRERGEKKGGSNPHLLNTILWPEETETEVYGLSTKHYIWQLINPENPTPVEKHGDGSLTYGCILSAGSGKPIRVGVKHDNCRRKPFKSLQRPEMMTTCLRFTF